VHSPRHQDRTVELPERRPALASSTARPDLTSSGTPTSHAESGGAVVSRRSDLSSVHPKGSTRMLGGCPGWDGLACLPLVGQGPGPRPGHAQFAGRRSQPLALVQALAWRPFAAE
jgi:hypothetical protein